MANLRKEVFEVCKLLKCDKRFDPLRKTMFNLMTFKGNDDKSINIKNDIANSGKRLNSEFFGILLAFEKQLTVFNNVDPMQAKLSEEEYYYLSFGNYILNSFVNACIDEISKINSSIAAVLNPYAFYVKIATNNTQYNFDLSIFNNAINAFKNINVYKDLLHSNFLQVLNNAPQGAIFQLVQVLEKNIMGIPVDNVPNDIFALKMREMNFKRQTKINKEDAIALISFKILALREIIMNAVSLIYSAMLGLNITVINEDNLIDIEKNGSNVIYKYKTVLIQDVLMNPYKDILKDIVLLDINKGNIKIHEFGSVRSATLSFNQIEGHTTKISFCEIDDELNPIFNLTKSPFVN